MKTALGIALSAYIISLAVLTVYLAQNGTSLIRTHSVETRFGVTPKFSAIRDTKKKKQAFFDYFNTIIEYENNRVLRDREKITALYQSWQEKGKLRKKQKEQFARLVKRYKVKTSADMGTQFQTLLRRAHPVPNALALAQAANESAWGTSRFARKGNNFFGQWCYRAGCGLVPNKRNNNAKHEVRVFATPAASVRAYIHNINTHRAYKPLRVMRERIVKQGETPTGTQLAEGLTKYSERGHEYVKEIQTMIRINNLE